MRKVSHRHATVRGTLGLNNYDRQTDKQTHRKQADRQTGRHQIYRQEDRPTHKQTGNQTDRQTFVSPVWGFLSYGSVFYRVWDVILTPVVYLTPIVYRMPVVYLTPVVSLIQTERQKYRHEERNGMCLKWPACA